MQFVPLLHSLTTSRMRNDLSGKDSNHGGKNTDVGFRCSFVDVKLYFALYILLHF